MGSISWFHVRIKRNGFIIIRLLGIIVFIVLLFKIDLHKVWGNLRNVDMICFNLAIFFQIVMLFLKGLRWNILKGGEWTRKNLLFTTGTFFESYAMGVITPGRLGEVMKAGYEKSRNEKWLSIYKIIVERGFDVGIFIIVAGLALWVYNMLPFTKVLKLSVIGIGLGFIVFSYFLSVNAFFNRWVYNLLYGYDKLVKSEADMQLQLTLKGTNQIFILSFFSNTATFISCHFLALGIALGSKFLFTAGGVAVAGLLNLLPITIMGLGTRELSFLYLFNQFDPSVVMAFSFLVFLTIQAGGGIISLALGHIFIFLSKKY